jgi:hypothetical protein
MAKSSSILNFDGELPSSDIWLISAGPYDSMIRSLCLPSGVSHSLVGQSLSGTPDRTRRWVNDIAYIYMDMILILWSYGMTFGSIIMITHTYTHIHRHISVFKICEIPRPGRGVFGVLDHLLRTGGQLISSECLPWPLDSSDPQNRQPTTCRHGQWVNDWSFEQKP